MLVPPTTAPRVLASRQLERPGRAVASADRAEAALHEADASRATTEAQLSDTRLAAPIDGVVSLVKAQVGEVGAPGAAPLPQHRASR